MPSLTKRGWRDAGTQRLDRAVGEIGLPPGTQCRRCLSSLIWMKGRLKPARGKGRKLPPRTGNCLRWGNIFVSWDRWSFPLFRCKAGR